MCILCILACLQVSVAALEIDPQFSIGTYMKRVLLLHVHALIHFSTCTMYYYSVTIYDYTVYSLLSIVHMLTVLMGIERCPLSVK